MIIILIGMTDTHLVTWKKEYYEDIGEQDEKGFFDYAYHYFIYSFYFHDEQEVRVRRYTDTMDECSIFFEVGNKKSIEYFEKTTLISAVVYFMRTTQGVKYHNYFDVGSGYVPVSPFEIEKASNNFLFRKFEE